MCRAPVPRVRFLLPCKNDSLAAALIRLCSGGGLLDHESYASPFICQVLFVLALVAGAAMPAEGKL